MDAGLQVHPATLPRGERAIQPRRLVDASKKIDAQDQATRTPRRIFDSSRGSMAQCPSVYFY